MADYAEINLQIVADRWPKVLNLFRQAPDLNDVSYSDGTPNPTLLIDGLHLTSACDRIAEAHVQGRLIPEDAVEATVYGLALGDLARVLLGRPQLQKLTVVLLNPSVALQALAHFPQHDWLSDPRLTLESCTGNPRLTYPFAVSPTSMRLAADAALPTRDALVLALAEGHCQDHWSERYTSLKENVLANRDLIRTDGDVASLFESNVGDHILVAGAGPTLDQMGPWIREHRLGKTLIAASTAVQSLWRHQIVPDVVLYIDAGSAHPLNEDQQTRFRDIPLVYAAEVNREALLQWPGPRLCAYLPRERYREVAADQARGVLWTSGTVVHSAVDLAVKMGAATVTLLGVDFAYPGGKSHAENAPNLNRSVTDGRQHSVIDGYGNRVLTAPNFIGYLRDLEAYIQSHGDVAFENTGRSAANIAGAPFRGEMSHG